MNQLSAGKFLGSLVVLFFLTLSIQANAEVDKRTRIVSLSPGLTEIVFALDAQAGLVGVSRQCDYPLAARLKPKCGDFNHPEIARLAQVEADLVLFSEQVRETELSALADAGMQVRVFPARTADEVIQSILAIGELTGKIEKARLLVEALQSEMNQVRDLLGFLSEDQLPRVYLEVDGPQVLYSVGRDSFMSDLIRLAGGKNIFAARPLPYLSVSTQEVVQADPQVVLIDHPFQYKVGVVKRDGWAGISAVVGGRVFDATDYDIIVINRPGPRLAEAIKELARMFHPEVFDAQKTDQ